MATKHFSITDKKENAPHVLLVPSYSVADMRWYIAVWVQNGNLALIKHRENSKEFIKTIVVQKSRPFSEKRLTFNIGKR